MVKLANFLSASDSRMPMISSQVLVSVNTGWAAAVLLPAMSGPLLQSGMGSAICIAALCPNRGGDASRNGVFF